MLTSLSVSNAFNAGGTVLCVEKTEKFFNFFSYALLMTTDVRGAVVSKPIAINITFLPGLSAAKFIESRGE